MKRSSNADETDNDLEDGEIEDDDEDVPIEEEAPPLAAPPLPQPTAVPSVMPTPQPPVVPNFNKDRVSPTRPPDRRKHGDERKKSHLTEAEKSVMFLHKLERAERERKEKYRKEIMADDFACNIEKAIATVLKKERSQEKDDDGACGGVEEKRGRKRKKKDKDKKKHKQPKTTTTMDSPKRETLEGYDEDDMLQVKGGSPERLGGLGRNLRRDRSPYNDSDGGGGCPGGGGGGMDEQHNLNMNKMRKRARGNEGGGRNRNRICLFYLQGKCQKSDDCGFSHDASLPMKLELCKFYLMDCCAKGDKCLYLHSEFPCKFYHTGLPCYEAENCKFAHGKPLSEAFRQILYKHIETAPKEILGEFPRLSREGALSMINTTQKSLEAKFNNNPTANPKNSLIPSLFDINVTMPKDLNAGDDAAGAGKSQKGDKPSGKVRQSRWQDCDPVEAAQAIQEHQQKMHQQQLVQGLGLGLGWKDQDMRVNSNGDVDMRTMPPILTLPPVTIPPPAILPPPQPAEIPAALSIDLNKYKRDSPKATTSGLSDDDDDDDSRDVKPTLGVVKEEPSSRSEQQQQRQNVPNSDKDMDDDGDMSDGAENELTIDEKLDEVPLQHLPKKQRELFLRIKGLQKENLPETQQDSDEHSDKEDWYSDDDDDDDEVDVKPSKCSDRRSFSQPAAIKPVEVMEKLGDLSKIDISAEVTKLLSSISQQTNQNVVGAAASCSSLSPTAIATSAAEPKVIRDPRLMAGTDCGGSSTEPKAYIEQKVSIYEQGSIGMRDGNGEETSGRRQDVDLRNLDVPPPTLDMIGSTFGDTDLRQLGRGDIDLRQLNLPFKGMQNYTPATEIDASIGSHSPMVYRVHVVDIPRPDYTGLKLSAQDAHVTGDPRLRKIFRLSTEEKDSPASPPPFKAASPPRPSTRVDPRRRGKPDATMMTTLPPPGLIDVTVNPLVPPVFQQAVDGSAAAMTYTQQINLIQNSAFYQSLTPSQKLLFNQEISAKVANKTANDPTLSGILSSLGLATQTALPPVAINGGAMNILANVNNVVGPMGLIPNPAIAPPPMNMMMGPVQAGLLGAAPGIPNMSGGGPPPDYQLNLDPRNGGLLGQGPFGQFPPPDNPGNFQPYNNDDFYPNEPPNYGGNNNNNNNNNNNINNNNNNRNDRHFRDRERGGGRRGRSWNNRHNNNRNYNNRSRNNRSNRSHSPP